MKVCRVLIILSPLFSFVLPDETTLPADSNITYRIEKQPNDTFYDSGILQAKLPGEDEWRILCFHETRVSLPNSIFFFIFIFIFTVLIHGCRSFEFHHVTSSWYH